MAYISLNHIDKQYGDNHVLKDCCLEIAQGQFVTLLGPSGCGKSTLLRCLSGLETISQGQIILDGVDITNLEPQKREIGMVFQQYSLFPNMTVAENIAFGLKMKKQPAEVIVKRVAEALDMVELKGKEKQYPANLSGGQQQRVALARAIVMQPKVLLLDEPLSAIDAKLRRSLQERIGDIHRELGLTTIFVTHDQDEAMILSDVIHLFNSGRIEQSGAPVEMYTAPRSKFAAGFIGHYNILSAAEFAAITGVKPHTAADIAIRPETLELSQQAVKNPGCYQFSAVIENSISRGNVLRYTLRCGAVRVKADTLFRTKALYQVGETVQVQVAKHNCLEV